MFEWLTGRKKRDRELLTDLMRAAAEGDKRAQVNRALGSAGIQLPPENSNDMYCIAATAAIVRLIAEVANDPVETTDDEFFAGIFSVVISNHLTRIIGAQFEMVATVVPLELFGEDFADGVMPLMDSYNAMSQDGKVIDAIGQTFAKWIDSPSVETFGRIVALYKMIREHE